MRPVGESPWDGEPERVLVARAPMTVAANRPPVVVKKPRGWTPADDPAAVLLDAAGGGESLCLPDAALFVAAYHAGLSESWEQARRLVDLAALVVLHRAGVDAELWNLPNASDPVTIVYPIAQGG
jgi:hypothetical protein